MLEHLLANTLQVRLVRFATRWNLAEFQEEQKIDAEGIKETIQFFKSQGLTPRSDAKLVFDRKRRLARTRFSNGSFPVLYASLEVQTAEAEVKHSFSRRFSGCPSNERKARYMRYTFCFNGEVKDLRPKLSEWPDLTHDSDYTFCNELGSEAKTAGLDGLLVPSARNEHGTNLPVFVEDAASDFSEGGVVAVSYDPQNGRTSMIEIESKGA